MNENSILKMGIIVKPFLNAWNICLQIFLPVNSAKVLQNSFKSLIRRSPIDFENETYVKTTDVILLCLVLPVTFM